MSVAIPAVMSFAIVFGAVFTVLGRVLGAQAASAQGAVDQYEAVFRSAHSDVRFVSISATDLGAKTDVYVTLTNRGMFSYADFEDWEVIVSYTPNPGSATSLRVPYATAIADGKWTVDQVYLDSDASTVEVIQPGVLNPQEEVKLRIRLDPEIQNNKFAMFTIAPPAGGPVTAFVAGP